MEARKLNPLLLAADKFQLRKMHPIVRDHLLFCDRKRIVTSLRGRRTDVPFRLGRECRSLRNNFVLCLSFVFKSRARLVGGDPELIVLWSELHGCSYGNHGLAASISSSAPKDKEKPRSPKRDRPHSFLFSTQKLCVPPNVRHLCRLMLNELFTSCLRGRLVFSDKH